MKQLVVVALGGNAILRPGQKGTIDEQLVNVRTACGHLAALLAKGYRIVLTHGNGPQVGNILIQNSATDAVPAMPMYVCGAESQGMIGYMIQQELYNELCKQGLGDYRVASVVTQDVVSPDDPAFQHPSKPVGPFYSEEHARKRIAQGEVWVEDSGRGWRKVVPSPNPLEIVELNVIRQLAMDHSTVICNGGGGIPVIRQADGTLQGVEAVIDKDLGGQRLATGLGADVFMILTDVPAVAIDYGKPTQKWLSRLTVQEARKYLDEGQFKKGSMGPKVEACCRFVESGGKSAIIGSLNEAQDALNGKAGTNIVPN